MPVGQPCQQINMLVDPEMRRSSVNRAKNEYYINKNENNSDWRWEINHVPHISPPSRHYLPISQEQADVQRAAVSDWQTEQFQFSCKRRVKSVTFVCMHNVRQGFSIKDII